MRPAIIALGVLLVACGDDTTTVEVPDETATSVDLSEPVPLPVAETTVATTVATTLPSTTAAPATTKATSPPTTQAAATYYANCDAVRAAGTAPLHRGEPGYRAGLDRDNDGTACDTEG